MNQKRILVVDDERDLCDILLFNLQTAGYQAEAAYSAEEALQHRPAGYDLLLLDVMIIIFLTAKDTEDDTLQGFSLGADDYVTKPFSVREVMARVKAVLNRKSSPKEDHLRFEGLVVNAANKTISIDGAPMALTRTEYELLHLLLSHRGQVFSRQQLLDNVWPQDVIVTERTVDVNMARLRKKLGCYAACLVSRTGFGYAFEVNNKK